LQRERGRGVPAKVVLTTKEAMEVVSVAQPLAELARNRANSILACVGCVLLISDTVYNQNCRL
jgi:hypothetical protein